MTETVGILNYWLALCTLILQLVTAALLLCYLFKKEFLGIRLLVSWAIPVAFVVTLSVSALTLVYSEVFGFPPCGLCWLQRVFLYPQVVLLGIALWQKRRDVADYIIGLSLVGAAIALYQHYLQMGGSEFIACPSAGGVDCAKRLVFELGYITFPLMSFTAFAFLVALMLHVRRVNRTTSDA